MSYQLFCYWVKKGAIKPNPDGSFDEDELRKFKQNYTKIERALPRTKRGAKNQNTTNRHTVGRAIDEALNILRKLSRRDAGLVLRTVADYFQIDDF
jgi:hypothetical protein